MALADTLLSALTSAGNFKEALGAALNRCEVGACCDLGGIDAAY